MNETKRLSPREHKASVKRLWHECFNDTAEFVDFYFKRVYSPDVDYSVEEDGRVVSALQSIPCGMLCEGRRVHTSYLSGVCTAHDYRRRGLAGGLVAQSVRDMRKRGCVFGFLIPAGRNVLSFYKKYGFTLVFRRMAEIIPATSQNDFGNTYETERIMAFDDDLYELFTQRQQERRGYALLHTRRQFRTVLDDWLAGGNAVFAVRKAGRRVEYAFVRPLKRKKTLLIYDVPTHTSRAFEYLTAELRKQYDGFTIKSYGVRLNAHEMFACARVIDVEAALGIYASMHPETAMRISVYGDDLIQENNGTFQIGGGRCTFCSSFGGRNVRMNITRLAKFLFSTDEASFDFLLE